MSGGGPAPAEAATARPADPSTTAGAHPLDNAVWHSLQTTQRDLAEADPSGRAVRYREDLSPFHAVDVLDDDGWRALAALAGPGEVLVLFRDEIGAPPAGWSAPFAGIGHQMVAPEVLPEVLPEVPRTEGDLRPIEEDDLEQVHALVALTKPGPFRPRTVDLGGYVGVFDRGRLIALAGERMHCPGHAEISAVCTHPDAQGRGLAARVTLHVAEQIRRRDEIPFLHVAFDNHNAIRLYERLGFTIRRRTEFVALRTPADGDAS